MKMKSRFKMICFALSVLLLSAAVPVAASAAPKEVPVLSRGLFVLAAKTDVAASAMVGNDVTFTADVFARGMNLSEVKYITVVSVPPETDGELLLGSTRIGAGQSLAAANLPSVVFHPASDEVTRSSFTFTANGGAVPMTCNLSFLSEKNYAPTVNVAAGLMLDRMTYRGVAMHGTLAAQDPDGDALTFEIVSYPKKGSVTLSDAAKGSYVYHPNKGYVGSDAFSYVARDPYGNYSAAATVSLRVELAGTSVNYVDIIEEQTVAAIAVTEAGVMSGAQIGNQFYFNPDKSVSRVEFLVMAMNAAGITEVPACEQTVFADDGDIPPTMKGYVAAAQKTGIASGTQTDGVLTFAPNETLTRAEAAVILEKLLEAKPNAESVPTFADVSEIPAWAENAVLTLSSLGIMTSTDGNISPLSNITRAQTAELLAAAMRFQKR
ncbi:MAG: S-layer homology domain-containing protein [Clostridia bacterium]|nr:S-layer homology domain-containing protein [Clostridia bacterium]